MNTGNLLSACMIVRDEEANLSRCLNSVKDIVDEIIIIDTGSTDKTIEIAKSFGARVYEHPWENDFSLHRNQALSKVTSDWGLIIDADEELCFVDDQAPSKVRVFLKRLDQKFPASALLVKDVQKGREVMQFNSSRIFRKGQVRYEGIVHNQPRVKGVAVYCPDMFIKHYGYDLTPEQKQKKFKRTYSLLIQQVQKDEIAEGLPYFYLCQILADNGKSKKAVKWGERYLKAYKDGEITESCFNKTIYFTMIKQYMSLGEQEKVIEWLVEGHEKSPGDIDLTVASLEYGIWVNDNKVKISAAEDFLKLYDIHMKDPSQKTQKFIFSLRPEILALVLYQLTVTQLKEGGENLQKFLKSVEPLPAQLRDAMMEDLSKELSESSCPVRFEKTSGIVPQQESVNELTTMSIQ